LAARAERFLVVSAVAGLVAIALVFAPGLEIFRSGKEALMRLQAIVSAFALAMAVAYGGTERLRELFRDRAVVVVLAGSVVWTAITTLTSGHRLLSVDSLVTVVCAVMLFVAVWYVARAIPVAALLVLVPGVIINTLLATLQEYAIWNPFTVSVVQVQHLEATALLGNPNDVGGYLALCAIVLFAAAEVLHGRLRWVAAAGCAVAIAGVFISQTRTAVLAIAATAVFLAARRSYKAVLVSAGVIVVALLIATQVELPALTRLTKIPSEIAKGNWNVVLSDRLPAFAAAAGMFREHPILGVGPGAYKFFYLPYRIRMTEIYPEAVMRGAGVNFAEAHNDHLQLLAEAGLPGYALFVAACVILARRDRWLGLPLVIMVAVLALAFFPLQIAATRHLLITVSALIIGWRRT
jgi:O-antigen ligase